MPPLRLEGKPLAQELRARLRADVADLVALSGQTPTLAVVHVEGDPASARYVRAIGKSCSDMGIAFRPVQLPATTEQAALNRMLADLSQDPAVHAILVQLPLPVGLSSEEAIAYLDDRKDVDGIHPANAGLLAQGRPRLVPNTPAGGIELLRYYGIAVAGKRAAVVGRSNVVGRPLALLLLQADATVTICHSRTPDLAEVLRSCDLVAVAAGRPGLISGAMLRPGAVVLDFGTNLTADGGLVGDVDYASAAEVAGAITPVPGGTGPVTNIMLLRNVLKAAQTQLG